MSDNVSSGSENKRYSRDRGQYVVMSNDMVRNATFDLSTQQFKILLYLVSKIKPDDSVDTFYSVNLIDLAKCCGLKISNSGTYYKRLKEDILSMAAREWKPISEDNPDHECLKSLLGDADIQKGVGVVRVRFNPYVSEYLFNLRKNYTQFELEKVLTFKSKYSIRMYLLLKSYFNLGKPVEFNKDTLQSKFISENEEFTWNNFKFYVLDKAAKEINEKADDINVTIQYIKENRSVSKVKFILNKPGLHQIESARRFRENFFSD